MILARLITSPQRWVSSWISLRISAGLPPTLMISSSAKRFHGLGIIHGVVDALLSLATIDGGVPGGALIAFQVSDTKFGTPASIMVGMSLSASRRLSVVTARMRARLPSCSFRPTKAA